MNLQPMTDKAGNVKSAIGIEFSALGEEINGFPSLLKRYVDTSINIKHGQSLVLAALLGSEIREASSGVLGLEKIPVLGELFKSRTFREGRTELAIVVTPRLVTPGSPENVAPRRSLEEATADMPRRR